MSRRWLWLAVLGALASSAQAQTPTMSALGKCDGMVMGDVGLAVKDANGVYQGVGPNLLNSVFGAGECQCNTMDVQLQIRLTGAFPTGTSGSIEVFVGSGCDNPDTRLNPSIKTCKQLLPVPGGLTFTQFVQGQTSSGTYITMPIPSRDLFSPEFGTCDNVNANNSIYVALITSDRRMPAGNCQLSVLTSTLQPAAPTSPAAAGGDSAVTVSWEPTTQGSPINSYQILCATADGRPVDGIDPSKFEQGYTQCVNGAISRRPFLATSSPISGDLGSTTPADMTIGGASLPWSPEPLQPVTDMSTDDAGAPADLMPPPDMSGAFSGQLDPRFRCSDKIPVSNLHYERRIEGLVNGTTYQFIVLAINNSGNVTPSQVVLAKPQATEDLWRRARAAGANGGFCAMVGPGSRPAWLVWGLAALALGAWLWVRARSRT